MNAAVSVEPKTARMDVEVNAGDLFDVLVPIIDRAGAPVTITEGDAYLWSAYATVRRNALASTSLHTWSTETVSSVQQAFIVPGVAAKVRLVAAPAVTATWRLWPTFRCGWDVVAVEPTRPSGDIDQLPTPVRVVKGSFRVLPQYTRPPYADTTPVPTTGYGLGGYGTSPYGDLGTSGFGAGGYGSSGYGSSGYGE